MINSNSYGYDSLLNQLGGSSYYWNKKTLTRLQDEKYLDGYGYKVYSQNDEDGIIAEIFRRIGVTNKKFIEFGVQDGLESNTHYLLHLGWSGLWIEGDEDSYWKCKYNFYYPIKGQVLNVVNKFITKENINKIFIDNNMYGEIDLLSIDIDGNDWHIAKAINVVNPRVIITEYNGKFPPEKNGVIMPYIPNHTWDKSDNIGASLDAFYELMLNKGYTLVGTNLNGVNAFFVRQDLVKNFFPYSHTPEELYNPARIYKDNKGYLMFKRGFHNARVFFRHHKDGIKKDKLYIPGITEDVLRSNYNIFIWGASFCGNLVKKITDKYSTRITFCDTKKQGILNGNKILDYHSMEEEYQEENSCVLLASSRNIGEMAYRALSGKKIKQVYHVLPLLHSMKCLNEQETNLIAFYEKNLNCDPIFDINSRNF